MARQLRVGACLRCAKSKARIASNGIPQAQHGLSASKGGERNVANGRHVARREEAGPAKLGREQGGGIVIYHGGHGEG